MTVMLSEAHAGDYVAIERDGEVIVVQVGRVLGRTGTKRRAFVPTGVIVNRLDPFTFVSMPFSCRHRYPTSLLDPDVEVVEVVAPVSFLRRLRYARPAATSSSETDDDDVDPIHRMRDRAYENALLEWREERRRNPPSYDDDIPF